MTKATERTDERNTECDRHSLLIDRKLLGMGTAEAAQTNPSFGKEVQLTAPVVTISLAVINFAPKRCRAFSCSRRATI